MPLKKSNAIPLFNRPFLFFLFLAVVFHMDKVLLGPFAPVRMHDSFDQEFSRFAALAYHWNEYGLITWLPNFFAGIPSTIDHTTPVYILTILFRFIPVWFLHNVIAAFPSLVTVIRICFRGL